MKELEPKLEHSNEMRKMDSSNRLFGGSRVDAWNSVLIDQAAQSLWTGNSLDGKRQSQFIATIAALGGIRPKDELEGMMAAQLIAAHNATMECYRRAMLSFMAPICRMRLNQTGFRSFQPQVHRAFSRHFSLSLMAHDIGELECTRLATGGEPYDRSYAAALSPMALSPKTVWVVGKG